MPRSEPAVGDSTRDDRRLGDADDRDEVQGQADRSGDLLQDPGLGSGDHDRVRDLEDLQHDLDQAEDKAEDQAEDQDEVWFEAEALAAASTIELGSSDRLGPAPTNDPNDLLDPLTQLAAAIASPGISLSQLPGWPGAGSAGQGLGALADELIGELRPGDLLVFGACERGVGRSSLLAQLGDGLALAQAPGRPVTPVLLLIEGPPALWRARSLARYFDLDARIFSEAQRARREPRVSERLAEFAGSEWARLDQRQRFLDRETLLDPERRRAAIADLRRQADGEESWPIVIVDPLEQLAGGGDPVQALARLAELARDEGLIVLASCDLADDDPTRARAIDSLASVRLRAATVEEGGVTLELCHRRLGPRGRGQLRWHRPSGRFVSLE
ncbi:MAG: hypothetical protein R6X02_28665 [Enhygromyxa sp.]